MSVRKPPYGIVWGVVVSIMMSGFALADAAPATTPEPSKDLRAKLADRHNQMATCLRSDKPFAECRSEMMKTCQQIAGDQGCMMMGTGAHRRMMKGPPSEAPKDK